MYVMTGAQPLQSDDYTDEVIALREQNRLLAENVRIQQAMLDLMIAEAQQESVQEPPKVLTPTYDENGNISRIEIAVA